MRRGREKESSPHTQVHAPSKGCMRIRGPDGCLQLWSWTSNLQNCGEINFCRLSNNILSWQPSQTKTQGSDKCSRNIFLSSFLHLLSLWFFFLGGGSYPRWVTFIHQHSVHRTPSWPQTQFSILRSHCSKPWVKRERPLPSQGFRSNREGETDVKEIRNLAKTVKLQRSHLNKEMVITGHDAGVSEATKLRGDHSAIQKRIK